MLRLFGFCVTISVFLVTSQMETPPPTTQQTRPADPENCKLNGYAPFGFLVKIRNKTAEKTTGHGSLISPNAVLTTATNHVWDNFDAYGDYEAIGQNIWNTNTWESCMQVRTINHSIVHDKCCNFETSKFFNFLIFVLNDPFEVSTEVTYGKIITPIYPVIFPPLEPISALLAIIEYNRGNSKITNCSLPLFTDSKGEKAVIMSRKEQEMQGMNYNKTCVPLMCEEGYQDERNGVTEEQCEENYLGKRYGTMMCVEPKDKSRKPSLPPNTKTSSDFYGGAPLLCNNVTFGMVTEVFVREAPKEHQGHFFLVVTFLRAYEWLLTRQQFLSNEQQNISVESWNMPPRYLSSEPVPAYFVDETTHKSHSISSINTLAGILALLSLINIGCLFI